MSLGGSGIRDWLAQRFSAVYSIVYIAWLLTVTRGLTLEAWALLFQEPGTRVASTGALWCILLHAWLGMWTVCTDYLRATTLRILALSGVLTLIGALGIWGTAILWKG